MELLKELTESFGPSGFEDETAAIVIRELESICDTVHVNTMGSVVGFKAGSGKASEKKKIMLAAHMDEIGFIVTHVDKKTGFLRFVPVGGFSPVSLSGQRVLIFGKGKHKLTGQLCIQSRPPAQKSKAPSISDYFIDLGLPGKTVARKVEIGDPVAWRRDFLELGDNVCVKSLDDRVGVYVMIEAVRKLTGNTHDIYAVGTTQEEVGCRGAKTSASEIKPDIGIAIDVTFANDIPGAEPHNEVSKLGGGAAIGIKDGGIISDRELVKEFRKLGDRKKIKYQLEGPIQFGATDAASIQMTGVGVSTMNFSIPLRYMHTVSEMANKNDINDCINLLKAYLEK